MTKIAAIVAIDQNRVIGKNNDIPWRLPADLRFFKRTTVGSPIIMGRKNYESIGRPLPKRTNIIITRNKEYKVDGCEVVYSIEAAIELGKSLQSEWIFIIGGEDIYAQTMNQWDRLYLTQVDTEVEGGDRFFPEIDLTKWNLVQEEPQQKDAKNPYNYTFLVYDKLPGSAS
ncbi:MAG: dihydrofolate reductase [Saprospiraceae bacterium]|nr:dihydrofolate reductase [Saprospiraceae bacterium]